MPTKTLRPSAQAFRNSGWLPKSKAAYDGYMKKMHHRTQTGVYRTADALLPAVREFKHFIETEPTVYGEFIRMFDDVDQSDVGFLHRLGRSMKTDLFIFSPTRPKTITNSLTC